jgi:hypothetical protein
MHTFFPPLYVVIIRGVAPICLSVGKLRGIHFMYNKNFVTLSFAGIFGVRLIGGYNIPLAYRDLAENTGVYCPQAHHRLR